MEMKLLVTGGCGFIGSNFIRFILKEREDALIINLDKLTYAGNLGNLLDVEQRFHDRYRFYRADIADRETVSLIFEENDFDWVVHFAAESHVDRSILGPEIFLHTNIIGTFNLIEAALRLWNEGPSKDMENKRFLHISTDEVYGSLGSEGLFTEETAYDPSSPYSASKAASDHLVMAYHRTYGLPAVITNCSNNYGPYQFPEKLIPLMIRNAANGEPLPVYGDGMNVRDWIHVDDHCRALLTVLKKGSPGDHFNIGGDCEKKNIEIVSLICDELDDKMGPIGGRSRRELIRFVPDRPGHDRRYAIDASKIKRELAWRPGIPFEAGIRRTVSWYLDNTDWMEAILDGSYRDYYEKQYKERLNEG
jgi:dTDP-glucose 4,6-dehydratase